jgi:hypothetical protein
MPLLFTFLQIRLQFLYLIVALKTKETSKVNGTVVANSEK